MFIPEHINILAPIPEINNAEPRLGCLYIKKNLNIKNKIILPQPC